MKHQEIGVVNIKLMQKTKDEAMKIADEKLGNVKDIDLEITDKEVY